MFSFSLIWCIVGCRIPSDAEKYETNIIRKEIFMDPTLGEGFSKIELKRLSTLHLNFI
jgi:hypothetical protein